MNTSTLPLFPILLIGAIGVQIFTSCSSDDINDILGSPSSSSGISSSSDPSSSSTPSSSSIPSSSSSIGSSSSSDPCGVVAIGSQTWQKCNSSALPSAGNSWCNGGWDYGLDIYITEEESCAIYGRLYDWKAAMAQPSVCPAGFRIPANEDWDKLLRYIDGNSDTYSPYDSWTAGRSMKTASGWALSGNGTNLSGFLALPGGYYGTTGDGDEYIFGTPGYYGYWWSASEIEESSFAYARHISYNSDLALNDSHLKLFGFSVRCMKDN